MSSFAWGDSSVKGAEGVADASEVAPAIVAVTADSVTDKSEVSSRSADGDKSKKSEQLSGASSEVRPSGIEQRSGKKRKKVKRAKTEEKEDGELDDENDDNNSQQNYDDDYDDYDFDEDSKNSRENEEVNSNGNKKSPAVVEAFNSDGKPTVGNATKDSSPVENVAVSAASSEAAAVAESASESLPAPTPNFQIPNPYDIEYEDYDSDDDDYGNSKRLKIDESEDPPSEENKAGDTVAVGREEVAAERKQAGQRDGHASEGPRLAGNETDCLKEECIKKFISDTGPSCVVVKTEKD